MTLADKLKRAAELQKVVDAAKEAKQELEPLRFEIMLDMQKLGSVKQAPVNGYYALYVHTPRRYIEDPDAVQDWLAVNGYDLGEYIQLSSTKVLNLADAVKTKDGEVIPGIATDLAERVDIKKVKESK